MKKSGSSLGLYYDASTSGVSKKNQPQISADLWLILLGLERCAILFGF
jgi:hypothetical protein